MNSLEEEISRRARKLVKTHGRLYKGAKELDGRQYYCRLDELSIELVVFKDSEHLYVWSPTGASITWVDFTTFSTVLPFFTNFFKFRIEILTLVWQDIVIIKSSRLCF